MRVTVHLGVKRGPTFVLCNHSRTQVPSMFSPEDTYYSLIIPAQELVIWDWKVYLAACPGKGNNFDRHLTSTAIGLSVIMEICYFTD